LSSALSDSAVKTATDGWGGDTIEYWESSSDAGLLIMLTAWDTTIDADEFFNNYVAFTDVKMGTSRSTSQAKFIRWQNNGNDVAIKRISDINVLILICTDTSVINELNASDYFATFTISASAGSNGSITPSGNITVFSGSNYTFTITPNSGYYIDNVLIDGVSVGNVTSYTFINITANHSISASFMNYWTTYNESNSGIADDLVFATAADNAGNIWFGTSKGISKFDGSNWRTYDSYGGCGVIFKDNTGNMWLVPLPVYSYLMVVVGTNYSIGLVSHAVSAIAMDSFGNKWFGTDGYGVYKDDGKILTHYNSQNTGLTSIMNIRAMVAIVQAMCGLEHKVE